MIKKNFRFIIAVWMISSLSLFLDHSAYSDTLSATSDNTATQNKLSTLFDIIQSMETLQKDLKEKKKELQIAETDEKKNKITSEMNLMLQKLDVMQREFEIIAVGDDLKDMISKSPEPFDLKIEIQEIFRPFIEELKNITSHPREIEKLRKEIVFYEKKLPIVQLAIANANKLINATEEPKLKIRLKIMEKEWQEKEKELIRQTAKVKYQLEQKNESKKSIVKIMQNSGDDFFKTRSINLILSIATFFSIFILSRFFFWWLYKSKRIDKTSRSFYSRFLQVVYHVATFAIAIIASLFLLYNYGDWMLLSIAIVFFIGIAWTTRHGLAMFWEQAKFMLNVGTVRFAERLVYDGVPWQITSLNLLTTLENPALDGGLRRLPLSALVGLQSRPFSDNELWFPSRKGDYVVLADNTFGKVIIQTPEMVTLEVLGGCYKTYPCSSFLGENPINLSINNFGVSITFGIDYEQQTIVTHEIPEILHHIISEELVNEEYGTHLIDILVQFKEPAASSLDVLIFVKFSGTAAEYYYIIGRALQRITVDACSKHGWGIPFTQITVHNSEQ